MVFWLWAPNEETAQWDTIDSDGSLSSIFEKERPFGPHDSQVEDYGIIRIPPKRVMDFFLFHELCWNGIMDHFDPRENLEEFYTALEHIPLPDGMLLCYNPTYLITLRTIRSNNNEFPGPWEGLSLKVRQPTLEQLTQSPKSFPKPDVKHQSASQNLPNCLDRIPLEVCEIIAADLSTRDVLNLRYVSRAMSLLFASPHFWRTRFDLNNERGFLFYRVKDFLLEGKELDWQLLYHCTNTIQCCHSFKFVIRSWERIRWLRDVTLAKSLGQGGDYSSLYFAGRALQHYHNTCYKGQHTERLNISQTHSKIAVSAVRDGMYNRVYVTGMEFIYEDGCPPVRIGYTTPGAEEVYEKDLSPQAEDCRFSASCTLLKAHRHEYLSWAYSYPGVKVILDAKSLRGFHVGFGLDGIYMVSLIRDSGCSQYVGSPYDVNRDDDDDDEKEHGEIYYDNMLLLEVKEVIATVDVSLSFTFDAAFELIECQDCKILDLGIRGVGIKHDTGAERYWSSSWGYTKQ